MRADFYPQTPAPSDKSIIIKSHLRNLVRLGDFKSTMTHIWLFFSYTGPWAGAYGPSMLTKDPQHIGIWCFIQSESWGDAIAPQVPQALCHLAPRAHRCLPSTTLVRRQTLPSTMVFTMYSVGDSLARWLIRSRPSGELRRRVCTRPRITCHSPTEPLILPTLRSALFIAYCSLKSLIIMVFQRFGRTQTFSRHLAPQIYCRN
jgi:hypothetical protein